ncbi:MAG TPA: DUF4288 domain-containing protein [Bacteroidia bacterium]|nr:DUF4288 domain-containing protein [Bacteroidia bacterium]
MNTYLVKLVFSISIEDKKRLSQFDEQIRLIKANDTKDAFFKARSLGKKEEDVFANKNNELVKWEFIDVIDIYSLNDLKDGEQLYALTHETEDADSFIKYANHKSILTQAKFVTLS